MFGLCCTTYFEPWIGDFPTGATLSESRTTKFVGREADIQARAAWDAAASGTAQTVHVTAPLNGGKHVLVSSACRYTTDTASSIVIPHCLKLRPRHHACVVLIVVQRCAVKARAQGKMRMVMTMRAASAGERTKRWLEKLCQQH